MKRFLIHLGSWLFIAFVCAIVGDYVISTGLRRVDTRKYAVWNDIYNGKAKADLVVIGSSRAWCGYNTYILDSLLNCNSYNLGLVNHPFDFQLIRYDTYRRYNDAPSIILLNTDFISTLDNSANSQYEREQFFPYINDFVLINAVSKAKHISWFERYLPLVRYFGYRDDINNGVMAFMGKKDFFDGGMHKGYRGNDAEWDQASLQCDTTFNVEIDRNVVNQIDCFVKRSAEEGIQVVFVKSPVYRPLFDHFIGINQSDSIFSSIALNNNIPILDYYYSPIGLDSTNFYNPSHLNTKGSRIFTSELCMDLKDILGY